MSKYDDHCVEMLLREDNPRRPGRAGTLIFGQEFKEQPYFERTPILTEIMPITGNYMMMSGFPHEVQQRIYTMKDGHKGGPYPKYNMNAVINAVNATLASRRHPGFVSKRASLLLSPRCGRDREHRQQKA